MQTHLPAKAAQTKQQHSRAAPQHAPLASAQHGGLVDNRPEMAAVLQLRQIIDSSQQAVEGSVLQAMMNNSAQARESSALQAMMNNSPRVREAQAFQHFLNSGARANLQLPPAATMPVRQAKQNTCLSFLGSSNAPLQLKTKIEYGDLQDFTFRWGSGNKFETGEVATRMHAELDPKNPKIGTDTTGSNAFGDLFDALQAHTPTTWVRGHLLNHDLGGIAHYNNLFPITTAANGEHYHEVEKHIKHWLAHKCEVTYDVSAKKKDNDGSPDGAFVCAAEVTKAGAGSGMAGEKIQKMILSHGLAKATTERVSRKKGRSNVDKYSGVIHGDANTVLRDDHGTIKKNSNWDHKVGTGKINNQAISGPVSIDAIDLDDWDTGVVGSDIEAGSYDSEFDQDAFDEWLAG